MLKYRPGRMLLAAAAASMALGPSPATAADATWEQWLPVVGATDVDGPRTDGKFVVAGSAALSLLDPAGTLEDFARGTGGYHEDPGKEAYIAVSRGGHVDAAACDFAPDETYILRLHPPIGVTRVNASGDESGPFTNIPGVSTLTGITFDFQGAFGHRLLVMGLAGSHTTIFAIDCKGAVKVIRQGLPVLEGQMAVAPEGFGAYSGQLIIPDETGRVVAIAPSGKSTVILARQLPPGINVTLGGVGFVPEGFTERGGAAYHVDRKTPGSAFPGNDRLLRITSDKLVAAGVQDGDLLAVSEDGGAMISVRCVATCTARIVIAGDRTAHAEGHVAFFVNPPQETPPPAAVATKPGGPLVPQAVVDFVGDWGLPAGVLVLLVTFLAAVAVQAATRREP
jgi:hypothetical protein